MKGVGRYRMVRHFQTVDFVNFTDIQNQPSVILENEYDIEEYLCPPVYM